MKKLLLIFNFIFIILFLSSCKIINNTKTTNEENINNSFGTWWWDKNLDIDTYLEFAKEYNINEIYFCDYSFKNNLSILLPKAYNYNIKVYLLAGEKEWLNDRKGLDNLINNYIEFQNNKFT